MRAACVPRDLRRLRVVAEPAEGDLQAVDQGPRRCLGLLTAVIADQDHLGGGKAAQLVFDCLHEVLVPDARARLDSGRRQRRHRVDQVALGAVSAWPHVRRPAVEEALAAGGHEENLG